MSHSIRVPAGRKSITLPDGKMYDGQVDVVLTDAQYLALHPNAFTSGLLVDLGAVADPNLDSSFATDAQVAAAVAAAIANQSTDAETAAAVAAAVAVGPGSEIATAILTVGYTITSAWADVPGWQIVVPANSGPHEILVPEGILSNIVTGTSAIAALITNEFTILDEANSLVTYNKFPVLQVTAVTKNVGGGIPLGKGGLPNNPTQKTYRVQARNSLVGTAGVLANIFTAAAGFMNPVLRATRR
jgi:hypothetical protein